MIVSACREFAQNLLLEQPVTVFTLNESVLELMLHTKQFESLCRNRRAIIRRLGRTAAGVFGMKVDNAVSAKIGQILIPLGFRT